MITNVQKKAWIEALRSKRYEQGEGKLRSDKNEWCCLGVLIDTVIENAQWDLCLDSGHYMYRGTASNLTLDLQTQLMPKNKELLKSLTDEMYKIKIEPDEEIGKLDDIESVFICLNDNFHLTFEEIADFVEKHLPTREELFNETNS